MNHNSVCSSVCYTGVLCQNILQGRSSPSEGCFRFVPVQSDTQTHRLTDATDHPIHAGGSNELRNVLDDVHVWCLVTRLGSGSTVCPLAYLKNHARPNFTFCACCLRSRLGPPLTALRCITYFRFADDVTVGSVVRRSCSQAARE